LGRGHESRTSLRVETSASYLALEHGRDTTAFIFILTDSANHLAEQEDWVGPGKYQTLHSSKDGEPASLVMLDGTRHQKGSTQCAIVLRSMSSWHVHSWNRIYQVRVLCCGQKLSEQRINMQRLRCAGKYAYPPGSRCENCDWNTKSQSGAAQCTACEAGKFSAMAATERKSQLHESHNTATTVF
jgi:hypothetical protein